MLIQLNNQQTTQKKAITMNYTQSTDIKLYLACAKPKDLRPNMEHIYMDHSGYAVATNGHILAAIPFDTLRNIFNADFTPLAGKYISAEVWKLMLKKGNLIYSISAEQIELTSGTYKTISIEQVGHFTKWQNIIPTIDTEVITAPNLLCFNPTLADNLAECLGVPYLNFINTGKDESNKALICSVDGSLGLLMPVMRYPSSISETIATIEAIQTAKMEKEVTI